VGMCGKGRDDAVSVSRQWHVTVGCGDV
jgi:hypothetical protein